MIDLKKLPLFKTLFAIGLLIFTNYSSIATAQPNPQDLSQYGLIIGSNLAHPMKIIMQNQAEFKLNQTQKQQLKTLKQNFAPQIHQALEQAKNAERQLSQKIIQNPDELENLQTSLDQLQQQKRQATNKLISALGEIQKILTTEQYERLQNKMLKK